MIVVGAPNSLQLAAPGRGRRARRLPARRAGRSAPPRSTGTRFGGIERLGVTAGASAPEVLVDEIIDAFAGALRGDASRPSPRREEDVAFKLPRELRAEPAALAWRSIPKSPTRSSRPSSASYDIGALTSFKGIAEGVENSNYLVAHRDRALHPHALREARDARGPALLSSALMEHLAARGITCPLPVTDRDGPHAARARRAAGRAHHLPRRRVGAARHDRALRARSARRSRACIWPAQTFAHEPAPTACRCPAGGRCPTRSARAPTRSCRALRPRSSKELAYLDERLAARPAARRDPRRPLPRQRVLSRRQGVGADRLLFRLQRHARLRRRRSASTPGASSPTAASTSPRRGRCSQAYEGVRPLDASRARRAADARARRGAALPADADLRLAQHRRERAGEAQGPDRISAQAPLPSAGEVLSRLWAREREHGGAAESRDPYRRRLLGQSGSGRLGRDPRIRHSIARS